MKKMALTYWNKVWVVITLCFLLVYDIRWLFGVFGRIYQGLMINAFAEISRWQFWVDYVLTGVIGDGIRLIGVTLALFSAYSVWGPKPKPFSHVKKNVAFAILFEGIYFLSILPLSIIGVIRGTAPVLLFGFILQILIVFPVLTVLSRKIWNYTETAKVGLLQWVSLAAISYLAGIWINNVFRWFNMTASIGVDFILGEINFLGFLNSLVTLSLSLFFAVAGFYVLVRKENRKLGRRLLAFTSILPGLYFVIYIFYSAIINALNYVILVEICPIPLLGLGISMLLEEN